MSWQSYAINGVMRVLAKVNDPSAAGLRKTLAKKGVQAYAPKPMKGVDVTVTTVEGMPVYRLTPEGAAPEHAVFYCHGGSYCFEISPLHWRWLRQLALEARTAVHVPIYPLAPRSTAATTVPATADVLRKVAAEHGADQVTVMGDSAGGGLALAAAQHARELPLRRIVLLSPWLDAATDDPRQLEIEPRDRMLWVEVLQEAGRMWAGDLDVHDPLPSPLHGDLVGLAPIDVFVGTHDLLWVDAVRLAAHPGVTLHEGAKMQHVWPLLPGLPEGARTRQELVRLCR